MKEIITDPATKFSFNLPADFVTIKDREVCEHIRKMSGVKLEQRTKYPHFS